MDNNIYVVTYGRLDNNEIKTLVVEGEDAVRSLARRFITVIPDDLDDYKKDIKGWKGGDKSLTFTHQDDDTFFFAANPGPASNVFEEDQDTDSFDSFVSEFATGDEDEEDEEG